MVKRSRNRIQKHHISYDPEIIVKIFQGEHYIITMLKRRTKNMSKGLLLELQIYLDKYKNMAVDLDET